MLLVFAKNNTHFILRNNMRSITLHTLLISLVIFSPGWVLSENNPDQVELSKATLEIIEHFSQIDYEVGYYGNTASEGLIQCSRAQDTWLALLNVAQSEEEYLKAMKILDHKAQSFRGFCRYVTEVVNFYNPGVPRSMYPQVIELEGKQKVFLNTFKSGKQLTAEEREAFFKKEFSDYWKDRLFDPFTLDETTLYEIEPETLYNFALLPDGTIMAALERPGLKEYHVDGVGLRQQSFSYPNHTILAGSAHQGVLTAGSFIVFQQDNKRLLFISNKSGHFQPTYRSLDRMRDCLAELGVNKSTVIALPDVDLAHTAIKLYDKVQIPVSINSEDSEKLFARATERWREAYSEISRGVLQTLANGNLSALNRKVIDKLNRCRKEATYMRNAFHLFSPSHEAPKILHRFVKHYGKLKDAIKHGVPHLICQEASTVIDFMEAHEDSILHFKLDTFTDDVSFYHFLEERITLIKALLAEPDLSVKNYHNIKKFSRELGTLFLLLAQEAQWKGNGHFLYRATSAGFFEINDILQVAHDDCVGKKMHGRGEEGQETRLVIPAYVERELNRYMDHFAVNPPKAEILIVPESAFWLINEAKWWYSAHAHIANDPTNTDFDNFDPRPKLLLKEIIEGSYQGLESADHRSALFSLVDLRRFAKVARNALLLLDIHHEVPGEIYDYIHVLDRVIEGLQTGNVDSIRPEAVALCAYLDHKRVPTFALETWECTDQESFNLTLKFYIDRLTPILENDALAHDELYEICESAQLVANLMELFRRGGIRYQTLPTIYYDLLHERSLRLSVVCQQASAEEIIVVTDEMRQLARFILKKVDTSIYTLSQ